jgi:competence protein ComEC
VSERLSRHRPELLAASLCLGLAFANAGRVPLVALSAAGGLAALACFPGRARVALLVGALALAGWAWGSARLDVLDRSVLEREVGMSERALLVVTGPARRTTYELRAPARVLTFGTRRLREPVLLKLPLGRSPPQGALLDLVVRVLAPREVEGGFNERAWLRRQGVHVVLQADRFRVVGKRGGLGGLADSIRATLEQTIAPGLDGERRAVVAGIVLGADDGLSQELRDDFRTSGLYHLLAVSGQNVALVAYGVLAVAWMLGVSRLTAEVGVLAAIAGYVLAVGWQPSVVRAGIAGGLASLAWLTARQRSRWHFMLVGAAILLAWNPYSLLEPGFQLSFGAVAAIFLGVRPLERLLDGYPMPGMVRSGIAVSVVCGIATAPILWLQFGSVPVYSVLSNALAAPAVPPLLALAFAAAALDPILPEAAAAVGWVEGWLGAYIALCARAVAAIPHVRVSSLTALAALMGLATLALLTLRLQPPRPGRAVVLAGLAALLGVAWTTRPGPATPPPPNGLRLTVLDVGQGDGILVQAPGAAVLVDQGPPEADVAGQLRRLGVKELTAIVQTHPQRDHIGGAAEVLGRLHVGFVLDPRIPSESSHEQAALSEARRHHVRVVTARAGAVYTIGRLRLRLLWPDGPGPPGDDPNNHAVVILVTFGSVDALLTADAESDVTLPLHPPAVEILKVGHHGSADAGLRELLRELQPRIAVISVGRHNDYGHPAPSTLWALEHAPGLALYRTDRDGPVTVESDGKRIWVRRGS